MTRPMLDFLIRLHKNGEDPNSMVHLTAIEYKFHFELILFYLGATQSNFDAIKLHICRMMELMMPDIGLRMKSILWSM